MSVRTTARTALLWRELQVGLRVRTIDRDGNSVATGIVHWGPRRPTGDMGLNGLSPSYDVVAIRWSNGWVQLVSQCNYALLFPESAPLFRNE